MSESHSPILPFGASEQEPALVLDDRQSILFDSPQRFQKAWGSEEEILRRRAIDCRR